MERLRASDVPWRLSDAELIALKVCWARKVVHSAQHIEARMTRAAQEDENDN